MNKKAFISMMLALVSMTGLAQEIKMNETAISDYIPNRFISPILFQLGEHAFLPFLVETQANLLGE